MWNAEMCIRDRVALDMGGDTDLMQDLGNGQLIAVHAGVQDVLFRAKCRLEHPCGIGV